MRVHSAGHVVHEAVMQIAPYLTPTKGEHGKNAYIEYQDSLTIDKGMQIEKWANQIVSENRKLIPEFSTHNLLRIRILLQILRK